MAVVVVGLLCVLGAVAGSPVRTFDQRQQGELNIHAQLDNIVIVLIPTSNLNLLELAGKTKYSSEKPDKGSFLQFFQKPHKDDFDIQFETDKDGHKTDIDRYETVHDDSEKNSQNDVKTEVLKPAVASQHVTITQINNAEKDPEKEEEVVATVEEMKPEVPEKTTDVPKSEASEDSPMKDHSTISETTQESVLKVFIPKDLKGDMENPVDGSKQQDLVPSSVKNASKNENPSEPTSEPDKKSPLNVESQQLEISAPSKEDEPGKVKHERVPQESPEHHEPTIQDLIRPVATKEENTQTSISPKKTPVSEEPVHSKKTYSPEESSTASRKFLSQDESSAASQKESTYSEESPASSLKKTSVSQESSASGSPVRRVEGMRKEKVIRYKPETKWAPGLVDLLGPTKADERQRFASLCSPGVWDSELKTCIMPGETRSRNELARFLEAMRFGIAVPAH